MDDFMRLISVFLFFRRRNLCIKAFIGWINDFEIKSKACFLVGDGNDIFKNEGII